jgi:hypothetical protein
LLAVLVVIMLIPSLLVVLICIFVAVVLVLSNTSFFLAPEGVPLEEMKLCLSV